MQTLDIISINLWNVLVSLANLVILFLIVKKFLFKPVKNLLAERQSQIDKQYDKAREAQLSAEASKTEWQEKLSGAEAEAERIIADATAVADHKADRIVSDAKDEARDIVKRAETEAQLTVKKAEDGIKTQIVEVSSLLAEKMLEREIRSEDHRKMIDSFIEDIGDGNE